MEGIAGTMGEGGPAWEGNGKSCDGAGAETKTRSQRGYVGPICDPRP